MKYLAFPLLLLVCCVVFFSSRSERFDLLIRNARIADGTGAPLVLGNIAVRDGKIVGVGDVDGTAEIEIDAHRAVAAPGFIDVHTHSEAIPEVPDAENFVRMGVTTIVSGNCGNSKTDILRAVLMWSTPALVRVSDRNTSPSSTLIPTQ